MTKTYMTKILTVLMLMMFSLGASADVKIFYGEKGEELKTGETKIKADNGTIAIEQKASDDGSPITIYLTFTPETGYTISSDNIEVYAVISPGSSTTRAPEISGDPLGLTEESSKDSEKRYSVKIDSKLGLWIKKAEFVSGSKGPTPSRSASTYILKDDEDRYMSLTSNTLDEMSSFDPRYALWTRETNGSGKAYQITSGTTAYYLQLNDAETPTEAIASPTDALGTNQEWTDITSGFLQSAGGYYVYRNQNEDQWQWKLTKDAVDHRVSVYPVTSADGTFTSVTAVIPDDYGTINVAKTYNFTVTPTITSVAYTTYTFNETPHYWYENADHTELPEDWGDVELSDLTRTWSLSDGAEGYATVNPSTGVLTVSNLPAANESVVITLTCTLSYSGHSIVISKDIILGEAMVEIHSLDEITLQNGVYRLSTDFSTTGTPANSIGTKAKPFTGVIDGGLQPITGTWDKPLFDYVDGAKIRNVIIQSVNINMTSETNVGAIAAIAKGNTRIYNCGIMGGSVGGTKYVGGLVGLLDGSGSARVINCYSYANITGGTSVGGIVGYNDVKTRTDNLKTMVMNCMFYGDITGGTNKAPIYNGINITNVGDQKGVGNYNYFRAEASYVQNQDIQTYNCALLAETRFLQRFEFFRHLLNSHRELAAWWATDDYSNKDAMAKWVLEPSQIGTDTPYPILKKSGYYPSVVNIDAKNATTQTERNKGGKLGTLSVTIQMGNGAVYEAPNGASITTSSLTLNITDKDPDHFNFNYYKVQLPYYNDVGTKNYTGNRVVVGWKITNIIGGNPGSFTTGDDAAANANGEITAAPYNFADRHCTSKDLYSVSGRIFNQGAYWDVPEGVTSITIQPYWAKAAYLADGYADVTYKQDMKTACNVPYVGGGQIYTNGNDYSISGEKQKVYTSMSNAISSLSLDNSKTVYDHAVVLVGNYHQYYTAKAKIGGDNVYSIMSIDLDHDNEPDYSYILRFDNRCETHPVRVDFVNIPGLGMAQKSYGGTGTYNFGIMIPKGWFESTNTSLFRFTQFEYEHKDRPATAPLILQGGVMEQWVSFSQSGISQKIPYYHVGGNVWFKEFHRGTHQDKQQNTKHPPISVTGGDFDEFYLTGLYRGDVSNYNDNLECYINGGRFGVVAGAAQEGAGNASNHTNGNVIWQIQNADIDEFYGGGLNAAHPVEGNITNVIEGGYIKQFCGGPKFGDMSSGKTVKTTASNCKFDVYFGAGYGGNSYSRYAPTNINDIVGDYGTDKWNTFVNNNYKQEYNDTYKGVSVTYTSQYLPMSGNDKNVARLLIDFVSFSLATTRNVTSKLTGCTITGNFYGGGNLGEVAGPVTSILDGCNVGGDVFGAGFSASKPDVKVMNTGGFVKAPYFDKNLGVYMDPTYPETVSYTWQHRDEAVNSTTRAIDKNNHILYTNTDLNALGAVTGQVTLTIKDGTTVTGDVYGGGESSAAVGDILVNINGGTINNSVYGGGKKGNVGGSVIVNINNGTISQDVYGGGALAETNRNSYSEGAEKTTSTTVNLLGGSIGHNVYGGGLGTSDVRNELGQITTAGIKAQVYGNVLVNLNGPTEEETNPYNCVVNGSVFGCNNLNGSPKGTSTVHVYKTSGAAWTADENLDDPDASKHNYHIQAVYGGGNLSAYEPSESSTTKTHVIIDGCDLTSIRQVYGGGNAASTPATQVDIRGTHEIEEVFGGGNGYGTITINGVEKPNPGANVGFYEYVDDIEGLTDTPENRAANYKYGSGEANVNIFGGKIHRVFGGSNTKGNVRIVAITMLDEQSGCAFSVDEAYGGGKSATMDGSAMLKMACIPGLKAAYGGAQEANIHNNVVLNITNGDFDRVFGGNNLSGSIDGSITVNVEETGCSPVKIKELYGGGNLAPYSIYGYKEENGVIKPRQSADDGTPVNAGTVPYDDPQIHIKSFTSIGDVYGGGLGAEAVMVGSPHVNINQVYGKVYQTVGGNQTFTGTATTLGTINNVFGGGNEAEVHGNTYVNIATEDQIDFVTPDMGSDTPRTNVPVVGADIRGNVYGGGNKAVVTGNTNVNIGRSVTPTP